MCDDGDHPHEADIAADDDDDDDDNDDDVCLFACLLFPLLIFLVRVPLHFA